MLRRNFVIKFQRNPLWKSTWTHLMRCGDAVWRRESTGDGVHTACVLITPQYAENNILSVKAIYPIVLSNNYMQISLQWRDQAPHWLMSWINERGWLCARVCVCGSLPYHIPLLNHNCSGCILSLLSGFMMTHSAQVDSLQVNIICCSKHKSVILVVPPHATFRQGKTITGKDYGERCKSNNVNKWHWGATSPVECFRKCWKNSPTATERCFHMTGRTELNDQCLNARGKMQALVTAALYLAHASLSFSPLSLSASSPVLFQHVAPSD